MCRLVLLLFFPILTTFAIYASVEVPSMTIRKYDLKDYKASSQNWDLTISPEGILYVANNSGLLTFDGNNWNLYELPDRSTPLRVEFSNDTIYTLSKTSVGFWLSDEQGNMAYHPLKSVPPHIRFREMATTFEPPVPLPDNIRQQKISAFASINGLNFIGTLGQGIFIADDKNNILFHLTTEQELQDNIIYDIHVESPRLIWVAFDNGLAKITMNSALEFLVHRSQVGKLIDAVLYNNIIYIQTVTNFYKRKLGVQDAFVPIPEKEALPLFANKKDTKELQISDLVKNTQKYPEAERNGRVYQISDTLYWLIYKNEARLLFVNKDTIQIKSRLRFDNYNANLVYQGKQIIPLNDSLYAVSTIEGIFLINTNSLLRNADDKGIPFRFIKIGYNNKNGLHYFNPETKCISLPHNFSELIICAGASVLNFNNQISYKIDDISSGWSDWQKEGKITFLQLPKGKYIIRVRKYVFQGDYPEITLHVEVLPPWYKTTWANLLLISIFSIILYILIRNYLKSQKKKELIKLEIERQAEQQKIQQMQNEMLEAELQNKKNELMIQTSTLIRKGNTVNKLLDELENQKKSLGERYPNRLYQRMHSLIKEIVNDQSDWQAFEAYFNSAHQHFIDRFRHTYSDITPGDLRLCCLLRMNLSTKEIASLLNISIRAVELRRYRLRKRIGLESEQNLTDFLINF